MVAIVDLGIDDHSEMTKALSDIEANYLITRKETEIFKSDKIILHGSGDDLPALKKLHLLNLFSALRICKKPILGIDLGMHLLSEKSWNGKTSLLGLQPGTVNKLNNFKSEDFYWLEVNAEKESILFKGIREKESFFFTNPFYMPLNEFTTASANYGIKFSAAVEKENLYGVQFHPEKSGDAGLKLLNNFIRS